MQSVQHADRSPLTEIVKTATHVCVVIRPMRLVILGKVPRNIQQRCLEHFSVKVEKFNTRTLHVFVRDSLLDVSVVVAAAITASVMATITITGLFSFHIPLLDCYSLQFSSANKFRRAFVLMRTADDQ